MTQVYCNHATGSKVVIVAGKKYWKCIDCGTLFDYATREPFEIKVVGRS